MGIAESPLGHGYQGGSWENSVGVEVGDQGWLGCELRLCPELLYRAPQARNLRAWVSLGQVTSVT